VTIAKGFALLVPVVLGGVLANASGPAPGGEAAVAELKAISARVNGKGASLIIEATEPTAYVASRPDPLTVYVDFHNVGAQAVANRFALDAKSPIAGVAIEAAESMVALEPPAFARADASALLRGPTEASGVGGPPPRTVDPIAELGLVRTAQAPAGQAPATQAPPAPPPAAGPEPLGASAAQPARRFTGSPVSLDFQGADLRAVLRTFSEISGLNMVIDPAVQGTVDVSMRDVPWDQALDIILRANKLDFRVDGTIVRIAPREVFIAEDKSVADAAEARAAVEQLRTLTRQISYARGEDIVRLLKDTRVISKYGQAQLDPRTNTVIITDIAAQLPQAQALIDTLDKPQPQVEIEARIVTTSKTFARALGIQWGFQGRIDPALGNTTNLAFPNSGRIGGQGSGGTQAPPGGTVVNLPVAGAPTAIGLALGAINGAFNLDVALSALESSGNGRLLSTPRVSTQNNVPAEIAQGVQVPYQTVANNTVTVQFKDAALILKVTPQITSSDTVIMQISVDNGSVGSVINGIPSINTQRANTTVQVNDGQTTVIGGIYASRENSTSDRTPGLSRVPLLKWLFKRDASQDESSELLIFITPRIIKG
jgi:type IV pilus assembly protein PilQ